MLYFEWKLEFASNILSVIFGLNYYKDPKAFIEYLNDMQDEYKNIEERNLGNERKIATMFDDMITDMCSNKNFNPIVTEFFIRCRKHLFLFLRNHILK